MPPLSVKTACLSERRSLSAAGLQPSAEDEDRSAEREQNQLAPDVAAEHAVEEGDPRHQESRELERAGEGIHGETRGSYGASAMLTRVILSPCSMRLTTSCPATTCPKTV